MTPAEILAAATRRTLSLPGRGIEIAVLDWGGDGPLALLHHANGFCKGVWGLVAWELRQRFRVVAMDARGHGDSSTPAGEGAYQWHQFADDLVEAAEVLTAESGDRIALGLGHSFGGTSFIGAAKQRPDLFERLLLLDPVVPPPPAVAREALYTEHIQRMVEGARRRRAVFQSRVEAVSQWIERPFFARCDPRAIELYALDGLRDRADGNVEIKCPGEIEGAVFAGGPGIDVRTIAAGMQVPALILWAAQGRFPRELHETIAAAMPQGRVEPVESGHLVPLERPDLVVRAVDL